MKNHLNVVASSYDKAIELGKKGIDLYKDLPDHLKDEPDYHLFEKAGAEGLDSSSGDKRIKEYLSPVQNMYFIDLGCCLNLMFNGYAEWPSIYHGVDISSETIKLLKEYSAKNNLNVGELFCGSIHKTPFDANYFDFGACIGVLEYFEKDFVSEALAEAYRILKPGGKFVLDIPNNNGKMRRFMNLVELSMGRPCRFDMLPREFEEILLKFFEIEKSEEVDAVAMILYFLKRRKKS
ncbi:MAG: class I SAM-dependent methyltransferase [Defluviitaleaceae bacterium]|nr:class I SAM-dependent methyltransferase [Defluviitaleaceae bacterium]